MRSVYVGRRETERVMRQRVAGVSLRAVLTRNGSYSAPYGQPFGLMFNGVPRVDFSKTRLTVTLTRDGQKYQICNDNLLYLACATNVANATYDYVRYAHSWECKDDAGNEIYMPIQVLFPSPIVLGKGDVLELDCEVMESFAVGTTTTYTGLTMGGSTYPVVTAQSGNQTYIDKGQSYIEMDIIKQNDETPEAGIYLMRTKTVEGGANNPDEHLGENVNEVHIIDFRYPYIGGYGFEINPLLRTVETVEIQSKQLAESYNYLELLSRRVSHYENYQESYQRRCHHVVYRDFDADLDDCRIKLKTNPTLVQSGKLVVYWAQMVNKAEWVKRSAQDQKLVQARRVKKILSK